MLLFILMGPESQDKTPARLAVGIFAAYCIQLVILMFRPIPEPSRDIVNSMSATLSASFFGIVGFYFGSSRSAGHQAAVISHQSELLAKATMPAESTIISESQESGGSKSESTISINSNSKE